jgi:hypothetical protein
MIIPALPLSQIHFEDPTNASRFSLSLGEELAERNPAAERTDISALKSTCGVSLPDDNTAIDNGGNEGSVISETSGV